jgi:hypothetical protein
MNVVSTILYKFDKTLILIYMKRLLFLTLALILVTSVNAQILRSIARSATNQVKNSAENRAVDETNKQVDKGVNKLFDNLIKDDTTKNKKNQNLKEQPDNNPPEEGAGGNQPPASMSKFMKSMGVSSEEVKHKDVYKFSAQIVMVTQATNGEGEKMDPAEYKTCFNETTSDASFVMGNQQGGSSTTIIDQENKCMLMLSEKDGKKTGLASKFDPDAKAKPATEQKSESAEEDCMLAKTGKSQTISGYSCLEYRCETSKSISVVWVTKEFAAKNNKLFGGNAMGKTYKTGGLDGMIIQYETISKTDKSSSIMTVKSIDMNKSSSFSTAGYEISSFSFGGNK